ncbi:hypothetical protein GH714_010219 [Hevea brasiliensis]|uniref:Uncharacterized protein n=1 Tax=Hevea brasiliensis TaxID=3981 RepID=A0A6A6MTY0_HEVBR|nr:hypothetical protein GH714_010219 [Hevea brasiliensis]
MFVKQINEEILRRDFGFAIDNPKRVAYLEEIEDASVDKNSIDKKKFINDDMQQDNDILQDESIPEKCVRGIGSKVDSIFYGIMKDPITSLGSASNNTPSEGVYDNGGIDGEQYGDVEGVQVDYEGYDGVQVGEMAGEQLH